MAINGIGSGSYGSYYNYQNTISQIRLQQALAKNPKYVQAVESVNKVHQSYKNDTIDFLKSYNSAMSDVMQSANALRSANSSGVANDLTVSSSDTDVATAVERYNVRTPESMTLDVRQLAAAQSNVSDSIKGSEAAAADMNFTIDDGGNSVSVNVSQLTEDGVAKSNRDMLREAAKQINASSVDITALVKENKDGTVSLALEGTRSGKNHSFTVSGEMGAAEGAQNAAVNAQNAEYSVTVGDQTKDYSSSTNNVQLDAGKIGVSLKGTGSTTISAQADSEKIASAVSDLIGSYNKALTFLNNNAEHGSGVINQIGKFANNLSSRESLSKLGITTQKDGTLAVDKDVLTKSLKEDPSLTKELISGSFGLAQTAFNRASSAMSTNSASLISNDLAEYNQTSVSNPINFMNTYSRHGANNMNNYYAIGLMMNFLT